MDLNGISPAAMANLIPFPAADSNKYTRGCLVVVGGSSSYPGAACLAACAGQRMGAGYTQVWCAPESVDAVRFGHPSLVVRPWDDPLMDKRIKKLNWQATALVVGCGFEGSCENEQELLGHLLTLGFPLVVDGGGISALAEYVVEHGFSLLKKRFSMGIPLVLTPHGGEAQRLCDAAGVGFSDDQGETAQNLAAAYCATVVLKGPKTVVFGQGQGYLMNQGTAALAKAGTGDVLAGIVGALLCQGVSPVEAGCLGSSLHAHAGHLASQDLTMISVIPEDVIACLPQALKDYLALRAR